MLLVVLAGLVVVVAVTIGRFSSSEVPDSSVSAPSSPEKPRIRFENRHSGAGIDFVLNNGTTEDKPIIDSTLGGLALFDFDNDGYLDIYFTNGARLPSMEKSDPFFHNRLYRNQGDETFADVTKTAGVAGSGYSMGIAAADFDNDGWADLYVTGVNRNTLYRNQGNGTFTDVTEKAGVGGRNASGKKPWSVAAAWLDYDNDGDLDLFVVNYLDWSWSNNQVCGDPGKRLSCSPALYEGLPNSLYRNNGDGTFTDVSGSAGIGRHVGKGMSAAINDYDGDGLIDVFVTNDSERNFMFRNVDGKRFEEVGVQSGVAFTDDGVPVSSMGVDFRDLNNDGMPDATVTALANETFPLFTNQGDGTFLDTTYTAGMGFASNTMSGWGNGAYDFDNDGHKDLFTANSHVSENIELYQHHKYKLPNAIFWNRGDGGFEDVTPDAGPALAAAAAHRGCAFGDLDNDGRIDVVVSVIGDQPEVLFNESNRSHHWLLIETRGAKSNRDGIGARIRVTRDSGLVQYNHVSTSVGYASSSDKRAHFGLGAAGSVKEIELRWPSGTVQVLRDVAIDQILRVVEE